MAYFEIVQIYFWLLLSYHDLILIYWKIRNIHQWLSFVYFVNNVYQLYKTPNETFHSYMFWKQKNQIKFLSNYFKSHINKILQPPPQKNAQNNSSNKENKITHFLEEFFVFSLLNCKFLIKREEFIYMHKITKSRPRRF